jgi:hypothetical protein
MEYGLFEDVTQPGILLPLHRALTELFFVTENRAQVRMCPPLALKPWQRGYLCMLLPVPAHGKTSVTPKPASPGCPGFKRRPTWTYSPASPEHIPVFSAPGGENLRSTYIAYFVWPIAKGV